MLAVYLPAIKNGFVNLDDPGFVYSNPYVQHGFTWEGVRWAFSNVERGFWHPITWLSLMLDSQLYGARAGGYHFTSAVIHALSSAFLFMALFALTGAKGRSLFVAALFGLHPLHVESVAWVSERKDVLSAFFLVLTIWCYAKYVASVKNQEEWKFETRNSKLETSPKSEFQNSNPKVPAQQMAGTQPSVVQSSKFKVHEPIFFYGLSVAFFAMGLMSKAMLVTTPAILLLLDFWPLRRIVQRQSSFVESTSSFAQSSEDWPEDKRSKVQSRILLFEKIPFVLLAIVFCFLTFAAQKGTGAVQTVERFSVGERVANSTMSYVIYLCQTLWPASLAAFYPYPRSFSPLLLAVAALVLIGVSVAAILTARTRPYIFLGWAWYVVTLLPVIGLVQVGSQGHADRYTYIPLIGIFVALAWLAHAIALRFHAGTAPLVATGTAVALACAALTINQIGFWKDSETLFRHALAVTKDNEIANNNLGTALSREGKLNEAIMHFREAARLRPAYYLAKANLGAALFRANRFDEAISVLEPVVQARPTFGGAQKNLGAALGAKGRLPEAISHLKTATELDPNDADAHFNLGLAYAKTGHFDDAIKHFEEVLRLRPNSREAAAYLRAARASKARIDAKKGK